VANGRIELIDAKIFLYTLSQVVYNRIMHASEKFTPEDSPPEEGKGKALFIRHGESGYKKLIEAMIDRPLEKDSFDPNKPIEDYDDLTKKGEQAAREEAGKLFSDLNPAHDIIYIATSPAERAVETAYLYTKEARAQGFTVIEHIEYGEKGEKEEKGIPTKGDAPSGVRKFEILQSVDMTLPGYIGDLFTPAKYYGDEPLSQENITEVFADPETPWGQIPREKQERWIRAKNIILRDDRGSWGENFFHHADEVKEIFPELQESLYKIAVF